MNRGATSQGIAAALVHVARRLGEAPEAFQMGAGRARWVVLWALAAAFPTKSPIQWAPTLGLEPNRAAMMLHRVRGMRWWHWRYVTEAMVSLIAAAEADLGADA